MEAPGKIFMPNELLSEEWQRHIEGEDTAYICKDVLLEWAKEKYNEYKQMDEDFQGDVFIGNRHAFAEVIAKIESL